jgi:hypothetical protein
MIRALRVPGLAVGLVLLAPVTYAEEPFRVRPQWYDDWQQQQADRLAAHRAEGERKFQQRMDEERAARDAEDRLERERTRADDLERDRRRHERSLADGMQLKMDETRRRAEQDTADTHRKIDDIDRRLGPRRYY